MREERQFLFDVEYLIKQLDKIGHTTYNSCDGPCFGRTRQTKQLRRGVFIIDLIMQRDYSMHPWGFSPSNHVSDRLEIWDGKQSFQILLSGGYDDTEMTKDKKMRLRKRTVLEVIGDRGTVKKVLAVL